ncbi:2'-hydroxyisoflavone reductase [Kitasatospora sp. GAS204A]|uniref:NAD-dependent epimerase/dehydratase family protein n=1 Tax=unclassified Kitasatospora TaxID=2633591 RepID=UPI0024770C96|nr:NAD-dependent epimerase/dehydratase family protein [Kitasatospora sp. GAS204B]MDH6116783.1 2'-hydroxyisoflavone reductase [Kitasatospora sp. GAS204B]
MRILMLGGSVFLGRAFVTEALARGHQVTTFNRGRSGPDLPGAEAVRGDRDSDQDLAALVALAPGPERAWDLVIDTSGQQPHSVARSARALREHAGRYLFVSSVHAFADWPAAPVDEDSPLHACPADSPPGLPFGNALKAGCERAVTEQFGERSIVLNCGLLIGPYENIGRLPWWLERIARGGRVLAPGRPGLPIQLIDARDFAVFGLDLAERGASGRYVTTGLPGSSTYGELLAECVAATGSDAELSWVADDRLRAADIESWSELPLWEAEFDEDGRPIGIWQADSRKARAAGLRCRPLAETVRDTWAWIQQRGPRDQPYLQGTEPLGIDSAKELRILDGEP